MTRVAVLDDYQRRAAGYAAWESLGEDVEVGMDVIAWSENLTDERAAEVGVRRVSQDELLAGADVLSIHLVLSDRTRGLIGAAELARMKPTAVLINTSRGPIVEPGFRHMYGQVVEDIAAFLAGAPIRELT